AERNNVLDSGVLHRGGDGVADAILKSANVIAGSVGWNHDVGGVGLVEGFGEGGRVGDVAGENLRVFGREKLQMLRVSADDTDFPAAGQKVLCHYVSSVAACSKNNVHIDLH